MAVRTMTYSEAAQQALREAMARDPRVVVLGEDVGRGGIFQQYKGIQAEFGPARVIDTPIWKVQLLGPGWGWRWPACGQSWNCASSTLRCARWMKSQPGGEESLYVRRSGSRPSGASNAYWTLGRFGSSALAKPRSLVRTFARRDCDVPRNPTGQLHDAGSGVGGRRSSRVHGA